MDSRRGSLARDTKSVGGELASVIPEDTRPWYKKTHLFRLNACLLSLVLFSSANGYDGSMMNGLIALPQWNTFMDHPTGAWMGFINSISWMAAAFVYPVAAWGVNKYGRRPGVWAGYAFIILATVMQTCAQTATTFVLARLFLGFTSAFWGTSVPLLITETAYPSQRGKLTSVFNCGWYIGSLLAAWATFGTRNMVTSWAWRIPSLLQIALPVVALPGFLFTPESPRWLISVGRNEKARDILATFHASGDTTAPLVNYEMIEIETTLRAEKEAHASGSYAEMFKTPGNRKRLLISVTLGIFGQWSGNGVVSYYLAMVLQTVGITSVTNQTLISACLQVWNLFFAVGAAVMVDRLGRRFLFLASGCVMLSSYIVITGLSGSFAQTGNATTGVAVIPFLFIYFAGYDIALTPLIVTYPCEIWPYRLRARGVTVTFVTTVLAIFFNIFVNPIALESIQWKYYLVFVAVLVSMIVVVYFFYPETRGYSLEQIAVLFDGDNAEGPAPAEIRERVESVAIDEKRKQSVSHHVEETRSLD